MLTMTTLRWRVLAAVRTSGQMSGAQVARLVSTLWAEEGQHRKPGKARWGVDYMEPMVACGYLAKKSTASSTTFRLTPAGETALDAELAMPLFDAAGVGGLSYGKKVKRRVIRVSPRLRLVA